MLTELIIFAIVFVMMNTLVMVGLLNYVLSKSFMEKYMREIMDVTVKITEEFVDKL